jgi:hypothetical protein
MDKNIKNIDDLFKEELGAYTEQPPTRVWASLEQKLGAIPPRTGYPFSRWAMIIGGACVTLLLFVTIGIKLNTTDSGIASATQGTSPVATSGGRENAPTANQTTGNSTAPMIGNSSASGSNENPAENANTGQGKTTTDKTQNKRQRQTSGTRHQYGAKTHQYAHNVSQKGGTQPAGMTAENEHPVASSQYEYTTSGPNVPKDPTEKSQWNGTPTNVQQPAEKKNSHPPTNSYAKATAPKPQKPSFKKFFEAGMKFGYETGFSNDASRKGVLSAFVAYNVSPRFAIMLQPGAKAASLAGRQIGKTGTYYKENADSGVNYLGKTSLFIWESGPNGFNDTLTQYNYQYAQSHDSVIKKYNIGGAYTEYELPVLLRYKVSPKLSVYGGANIVLSKMIQVKETSSTYKNITRMVDTFTIGMTQTTPPPTNQVITYNGIPTTSGEVFTYNTSTANELRVGWMFGVSYDCSKRWLVDALIQQANVAPNMQGGYNTNSALSAPYIRLSLGYKLFGK